MKSDYSEYLLLAYISALFVVIPLLIGYSRIKHLKAGERFWLALITISSLVELVNYSVSMKQQNNLYIYHIYTVLEFTLISLFYTQAITSHKVVVMIKVCMFLFLGVAGFDLLTNGYKSMDNLSTTTESIVFILYSSIFFYLLLRNPIYVNVLATPVFWLNSAVLLYFSGNIFLFIFTNYMESHSQETYVKLYGIHSVLNILFYSLISLGFWKTKTR